MSWKPLGLSSSITPRSLCDLGKISQPLFNFFLSVIQGSRQRCLLEMLFLRLSLEGVGGKASGGRLVGK